MAEIAAPGIGLRVPVECKFELRRALGRGCLLVVRRSQEDQREAALLVFVATDFLEPQLVAIEVERGVDVGNANHRVQIAHSSTPSCQNLFELAPS